MLIKDRNDLIHFIDTETKTMCGKRIYKTWEEVSNIFESDQFCEECVDLENSIIEEVLDQGKEKTVEPVKGVKI